MSRKLRQPSFALGVVVMITVTGGWLLQTASRPGQEAHRLTEVIQVLSALYLDSLSDSRLYEMAIEGMIAQLDPHTQFLTPSDYEEFRLQSMGEYAGIGAEVSVRGDWATVIAPLPDSPAERAGLRPGDRIVEIDQEPTRGWSQQEVVGRLRGPRGMPVTLRIVRIGLDGDFEVSIVRQEIVLRSVPSALLMEDAVGYVELAGFGPTAAQDLRDAVDALVARGATKLILDMRRNAGGLMDQGIEISDLFLEQGQGVAELRGRSSVGGQRFTARRGDLYPGMPVVVLQSSGSASAAEIVAGALQDHNRALILGEASFGKGLVQTMFPLKDDHWLVLTTARWYTPLGRTIQRPLGSEAGVSEAGGRPGYRTASGRAVLGGGGISPDVTVPLDTLEGTDRRVVQRLMEQDVERYLDARLEFTAGYVAQNPGLDPDFTISKELLDGFHAELERAGLTLDRDELGASTWVAFDLAGEIAYAKWGEVERRRRLNMRDAQVRRAHALLIQANSPEGLLSRAAGIE
jgi:carboxyl-terminal processing protease